METLIDRERIEEITAHYLALTAMVPLREIRDEPDYDKAVAAMNGLLDAGASEDHHPLAELVQTLGTLIADYDDQHYRGKAVSPAAMLRLLMEQHGLTQADMTDIGSQGVVSEILNGKRVLNVRQVKALSKRFKVPPAVFIA
jgi:HTH-type transcriptional regulator/antitoxin HigA